MTRKPLFQDGQKTDNLRIDRLICGLSKAGIDQNHTMNSEYENRPDRSPWAATGSNPAWPTPFMIIKSENEGGWYDSTVHPNENPQLLKIYLKPFGQINIVHHRLTIHGNNGVFHFMLFLHLQTASIRNPTWSNHASLSDCSHISVDMKKAGRDYV